MSSSAWGLLALFLIALLLASWPLGLWIARISTGRLPRWMLRSEVQGVILDFSHVSSGHRIGFRG